MKKLLSMAITLAMLITFMSGFGVQAASTVSEWVEIVNDDFSTYTQGQVLDSFENWSATDADDEIDYTVDSLNNNPALKIDKKVASATENDRLWYTFDDELTGKTELSFKLCKTNIYSQFYCQLVDNTGALIARAYHNVSATKSKMYVEYMTTANTQVKTNNTISVEADKYVDFSIKTDPSANTLIVSYGTTVRTITDANLGSDIAQMGVYITRGDGQVGTCYIDDFLVNNYQKKVLTGTIDTEFTFDAIANGQSQNAVANDLNLMETFVGEDSGEHYISWASSDTSAIDAAGHVTLSGTEKEVTLTATLTQEEEIKLVKEFKVRVLAIGAYSVIDSFENTSDSLDYTTLNAIKNYVGKNGNTWSVRNGATNTSGYEGMSATIGSDPENVNDNVLSMYRSISTSQPKVQRVFTGFSDNSLNKTVYVSYRMYIDTLNTELVFYAYADDAESAGKRIASAKIIGLEKIQYTMADGNTKTDLRTFETKKWIDVTFEFNMARQVYNVYIDGKSSSGETTFVTACDKPVLSGFEFDLSRGYYTAESRIFVDDLGIRTTDGSPYSLIDCAYTDENAKLANTMLDGGFVSSVSLKKIMSTSNPSSLVLALFDKTTGNIADVRTAAVDTENGRSIGNLSIDVNMKLPEENIENYLLKIFLWENGSLKPIMDSATREHEDITPTIFIAGDSLAKRYSANDYPQKGYGQVLDKFFDDVNIVNYAEGGRSSKSFIETDGRLAQISSQMSCGDYLLIQFGHNDSKIDPDNYRYTDPTGDYNTVGSYKYYLKKYIDAANEKGATPILVKPQSRLEIVATANENLTPYYTAMEELATELDVMLIDVNSAWISAIGGSLSAQSAKNYYMYVKENDTRYANDAAFAASKYVTNAATYPLPHEDGTHSNVYSAEIVAGIIAGAIKNSNLEIADRVNNYTPVNPWQAFEAFE